jgi:hypothetical protein
VIITPGDPNTSRRRIIIEGVTIQIALNFLTVAIALVFVFVLALRGELAQSSVTALYGGAIGHTLATAGTKRTSGRREDENGS